MPDDGAMEAAYVDSSIGATRAPFANVLNDGSCPGGIEDGTRRLPAVFGGRLAIVDVNDGPG